MENGNHIQGKTTAKNAAADHPQSRFEGKRCLPEAEGPHTQCTVKWDLVAQTPGEELIHPVFYRSASHRCRTQQACPTASTEIQKLY